MTFDSTGGSSADADDRPLSLGGQRRLDAWLLSIGVVAGAGLIGLYRTQPDAAAAVTVIPAWCWGVAAVAIAIVTRDRRRSFLWIAFLAVAALFVGLCVEPAQSLSRGWFTGRPATPESARAVRVVSLNCHVGTADVIDDLEPLQPDLVLLQESPAEGHLRDIAGRLFGVEGGFVSTGDCSIVARGKLEMIPAPRDARFVMARWLPANGPEAVVASLRLTPPPTRLDYWRAACWAAHRRRRETHRDQLAELADALEHLPPGTPVIVGGDFNSPGGDPSHAVLSPRLSDAYASSGRGWGCTFSRGFPFHRIDQIWTSGQVRVLSLEVEVAPHTDHRAVICDVVVQPTARE
jgi:hypothetical protein